MVKKFFTGIVLFLFVAIVTLSVRHMLRYQSASTMVIPIEELGTTDYPEDRADRSKVYGKYDGRRLILVKKDPIHFDFIFESEDPETATIILKNIDLSLYIPIAPEQTRTDKNLEIIALTDREWNRQQVRFNKSSPHFEILGGDGYEEINLFSAELTRNCLNAGLWELLLYTQEEGKKTLYYQGWFTFPLGHYKEIFEANNITPYWKHWFRLEHWFDPEGTETDVSKLREVIQQKEVVAKRNPIKNGISSNDKFPSYIPPGRYSDAHPWDFEYEQIASLQKAYLRTIKPSQGDKTLNEIELVFRSSKDGTVNRFIVSGFNVRDLPQLSTENYLEGLYMPLGIGVPPFYQDYEALKKSPPYKTPYFSLLLDSQNRWINHHEASIDSPVLHLDLTNPNLLHLYILSYERRALVAHFTIELDP